jgi:UDPglucose 6-dehydrogenase
VIKYAANSFIATKLSFINAVAEFCEAAGADVRVVSEAMSYDARVGQGFLTSGLGFGGGCVGKDIRALQARAGELGVGHVFALLAEVDEINMRCRERVIELLRRQCGGGFAGRRIAVLGAAFKPQTDDIRDSPALYVADAIHRAGGEVVVYDPQALTNARRAFPELTYAAGLIDAVSGADAVAVLTDWAEFGGADPGRLAQEVRRRNVVDARQALDADRWVAAGWSYAAPGRPAREGAELVSSR